MILLAPVYFYLAMAIAGAVVALHCIVTRQPASSPFPTARFVPPGSVSVTRIARPEDLVLLLVRALATLLVGLAFAHPVLLPQRHPRPRIVLLDRSAAVADWPAASDSARALLGPADVLIEFDSATTHSDQALEGPRAITPGRLSPALIEALRTGSRLRASADSIELVIVSPLLASEWDGATPALRALWPGRIRVVEVVPVTDSGTSGLVEVKAGDDDGVRLALALAGLTAAAAPVRLLRGPMSGDDSLWASKAGHTLVRWDSIPAGHWQSAATADTSTAVVSGEAALVYPLRRRWRAAPQSGDRVVARWVDGEPAALEREFGAGCVRDISIPVPSEGDVVLRLTFRRLLQSLVAPCASQHAGPTIAPGQRAALTGTGPLARGRDFPPVEPQSVVPQLWLLLLALGMLALEQWLRRGGVATAGPSAAERAA